jgi:hypothetical protein
MTEGKRPLDDKRRSDDNIKTGIRKIVFVDMNWIHLAQDRDR